MPRCPKCQWHLRFEATPGGWAAFCWNKHCPHQNAGHTPVMAESVIADGH